MDQVIIKITIVDEEDNLLEEVKITGPIDKFASPIVLAANVIETLSLKFETIDEGDLP